MVLGTVGIAAGFLVLYIVFGMLPVLPREEVRTVVGIILLVLTILFALAALWMTLLYRAFSYNGKRRMSKQIIDGVAAYVNIPDGGKGLDIGCGSGALTIACAKRNPKAEMLGIDRWGREYASFSRQYCLKP